MPDTRNTNNPTAECPTAVTRKDRRQSPRFRVISGVLAVLGPDSDRLGPVIDIGKGGLAFCYNLVRSPPKQEAELTILFDNAIANYSNPAYRFSTRIVFEKEMPAGVTGNNIKMKCAVQFKNLTFHQNSWIDHFIQNYTIGNQAVTGTSP